MSIYTREYRYRLGAIHGKHSYGSCIISVKAKSMKRATERSLKEFYKQYPDHTVLSFSLFKETTDDQPRNAR